MASAEAASTAPPPVDPPPPPAALDARRAGLGSLAALPDDVLCYLLHTAVDTRELAALAQASKLLRVFVCEEPVWLQRHLDRCRRPFSYRVSGPSW